MLTLKFPSRTTSIWIAPIRQTPTMNHTHSGQLLDNFHPDKYIPEQFQPEQFTPEVGKIKKKVIC